LKEDKEAIYKEKGMSVNPETGRLRKDRVMFGGKYWAIPFFDGYKGTTVGRGRYILEHRYVAECKLGRLLRSGEEVHHIDHDRNNNDPKNLEVLSKSEHAKIHARRKTRMDRLKCDYCGCTFEREMRYTKAKSRQNQNRFFCSVSHFNESK